TCSSQLGCLNVVICRDNSVVNNNTRWRFFSHYTAAPRHLHSFPTRRSSDLCASPMRNPNASASTVSSRCSVRMRAARALRWWSRSEEHTSELQSRENLVCRLLLEKKKTNSTRRIEILSSEGRLAPDVIHETL